MYELVPLQRTGRWSAREAIQFSHFNIGRADESPEEAAFSAQLRRKVVQHREKEAEAGESQTGSVARGDWRAAAVGHRSTATQTASEELLNSLSSFGVTSAVAALREAIVERSDLLTSENWVVHTAYRWHVAGEPVWLEYSMRQVGESYTAIQALGVLFRGSRDGGQRIDQIPKLERFFGSGNMSNAEAALHRGKLKAKVFFDRYVVLASVFWRTLAVLDLQTDKAEMLTDLMPDGDLLDDVFMTSDGRFILQVNTDGQLFLHEMASKSVAISGRYVDNEVILYTREGYYWSSYEGAHFVYLRFPGLSDIYSFQQFAPTLQRPEFVKSRLGDLGGNLPQPSVTVPPRVELTGKAGRWQNGPRVSIRTRGVTELSQLRLYLDGHRFHEFTLTGTDDEREIAQPAPGHARWLTAIATDKKGVVSAPQAVRLPHGRATSNRLHAVLVGVDTYPDPKLNLAYARSDARRLGDALRSNKGQYYAKQSILELLDGEATTSAIMAALQEAVAAATAQDTIVFSFAGHGLKGSDERYYLTPAGFRSEDTPRTGLPWSKIAAVLQLSRARVVVILDACHSGLSGVDGLASNDDAAAALLSGAQSPMLVLAASKGRQFAEEKREWGGGAFTFALIEALHSNRKKYDLDGNGAIEVSELYRALKVIVGELTEGRQTPWLVRQDLIGDFSLHYEYLLRYVLRVGRWSTVIISRPYGTPTRTAVRPSFPYQGIPV